MFRVMAINPQGEVRIMREREAQPPVLVMEDSDWSTYSTRDDAERAIGRWIVRWSDDYVVDQYVWRIQEQKMSWTG